MSIPTINTATPRGHGLAESLATGLAVAVCVQTRVADRLLAATSARGWALSLVVVVIVVNGARSVVRAPFTVLGAENRRRWMADELRALVATAAVGAALSLPIYALLRATPLWWVYAWIVFAVVTVLAQVATLLTLRAQSGPVRPAPDPLAGRVLALGRRAGVDVGAGVAVAGAPESRRCNAYVVGLGPTRRVVLEQALAAWPPDLVDQVVAHEIGHWRLGHAARRLPLTIAVQLATFAFAAWALSSSALLGWAGVTGAGDPRSYPLLVLLTPALALPARCLLAWRDRAQERAADEFALALLQAPDAFASMLERAADEGGAARTLSWWRHLVASHPPIEERGLLCMRFASTT